ncbi:MAG: hypothetical protein V1936_01095, partial [Patescibacteria group bacterium]
MILDRILFGSHLQEGERLLYVVHAHWFTAYRPVCKVSFFGMLIPVLFYAMFPIVPALWIFGFWFAIGALRFFREVADWYFDVFLVTDQGVIDLDWNGIFDKSSTRIGFDDISGTGFEKKGFLANLLNFGDFSVKSDANTEMVLPQAAAPQRAEKEIMDAKEKYSQARGLEDEKVLREILTGMVKRQVK